MVNMLLDMESPQWGAGHANMHLINRYGKGFCFLLCVIDIYS